MHISVTRRYTVSLYKSITSKNCKEISYLSKIIAIGTNFGSLLLINKSHWEAI